MILIEKSDLTQTLTKRRNKMKRNYSWSEIANMPLCCICCGSRNVDTKKNICLSCGSDEGLWADERTDEECKEKA